MERAAEAVGEPEVVTVLGLHARNPTNGSHGHWSANANRVKAARLYTWGALEAAEVAALRTGFRALVTLVRIAPRPLDDDNLRPSLKGVRDQVAVQLGLKSDRDPRVAWAYEQRRGGVREYAVEVRIERHRVQPA